jgi:dephospho-CoA kinase
MKVLGITGGIATGKSVIVRELGRRGYPVYEADGRAKFLMETDPVLQQELKSLLGVRGLYFRR